MKENWFLTIELKYHLRSQNLKKISTLLKLENAFLNLIFLKLLVE